MNSVLTVQCLPETDERWAAAVKAASSPQFQRSERLRQFLLYVCEHTIRGSVEQINEHDIGCRVFGRPSGFNRSEDSIVRVEARNLRKRLEAYYASEGSDDPIVITIPKGSYVPSFDPRATAQPATSPVPAPPVPSRRRYPLLAVLTAVLVASLALNFSLITVDRKPDVAAGHDLWATLLTPDRQTQIVVGDTCTLPDQHALGRTLSLEEYLRFRRAQQFGEDRQRPPLAFHSSCESTSFGDVSTVARLLDTNRLHGRLVAVKYARDLQIRDFKQDHFILLGGPRSNPWVQLFEQRLNFVRGFGPDPPFAHFRNRSPKTGEQEIYHPISSDGRSGQDYGSVAWLPNLAGTGKVLIVTGASMIGMEAAAEFITRQDLARVVREALNSRAGEIPSFEILLGTTRVSGTTRSTEIVASRAIPNAP